MRPKLHQEIEYLNLAMVNNVTVAMEVKPILGAEIWEG
jgi:hypothetical protein